MYIEDFTSDKDVVIAKAFNTPKMHPKKKPDIETAMRAVGDMLKREAIANIANEVRIDLTDAIVMIEITDCTYEDCPEDRRGDYESAIDDAVEKALERYDDYLSADWLGKNTIDTELWLSTDEDRSRVVKLAESAGKEIFKELTHDKTPAQILANAGIVRETVETALAEHMKQSGEKQVAKDTTDFDSAVSSIKEHVGKDFDLMAVFEDVETIIEGDDGLLVGSAASRLNLNQAGVDALQMFAMTEGSDDPAQDVVDAVVAYKPKSGRQAKAEVKAAKAEAKAEAAEAGVPSEVFEALKECGAKDTDMAEALGVSRSTYVNYVKGKTHCVPDEDQSAFLRNEVLRKTNLMLSALAAFDGVERTEVS